MKTVFSSDMTAHVWAALSQPNGRNAAGCMSFKGAVAYSYTTPVAHIVDTSEIHGANGTHIALISSGDYGVTSNGKHIPKYRQASRHLLQFTVPDLLLDTFHATSGDAGHRVNLSYLRARYDKTVELLMNAQADNHKLADMALIYPLYDTDGIQHPTMAHSMLADRAREIAKYLSAFNLVHADSLDYMPDAERIIARRDRLLSDPKRVAKREASARAREAANEKRSRRAEADRAERGQLQLSAWMNGESMRHLGRSSCGRGGAMLRRSKDGATVETSWGAEVPVGHAARALAFYDAWRAKYPDSETVWSRERTEVDLQIGSFQLNAINADGSIRVGCHTIYAAQIEHLRALLDPRGSWDANGSPLAG